MKKVWMSKKELLMTKRISSIDLVLENCESIPIDSQYIYSCAFTINKEYYWCSHDSDHEVYTSIISDDFYTVIKDLDKIKYISFSDKEINVLDRLISSYDITHVDVHYDDGSHTYIGVPWGKSEYSNDHMIIKKYNNKHIINNKDCWEIDINRKWNITKIVRMIKRKIKVKIYILKRKLTGKIVW